MLALALREPALLDRTQNLAGSDFSVPLLGQVFDQLLQRHCGGLEVSLGVLEGLEPEEISHIAGICQKRQGPVNEDAFRDCINTIRSAQQAAEVSSDQDLLAFRNKLKESKGTKA